jgi:hypothetical protein
MLVIMSGSIIKSGSALFFAASFSLSHVIVRICSLVLLPVLWDDVAGRYWLDAGLLTLDSQPPELQEINFFINYLSIESITETQNKLRQGMQCGAPRYS